MSEWTHSEEQADYAGQTYEQGDDATNSAAPVAGSYTKKARKGSWIPTVAGTLVILVAGGVIWQVFKAENLQATTGQAVSGTPVAAQPTTQALAKVNDQFISYDAVASECFSRIGSEVLDNIINRTIIQQEVQKRGIVVSEAEVQQEIVKIAKEFNLGVDMWYQMLTTERGITPEQYRKDIIWPKLALEKLAGDKVVVSDADMEKAFVRNYGPRVRSRMIMLDNIRRANEIWEKASRNPEEFERLARETSIDPNSRALGGSIPPIQRHSGNPELENAAFNLKAGEISSLIQIDVNRYVILKCEGQTEPIVTDIKTVWNDLYAQLEKEKTQEKVATIFEDVKKTARVDNYLTNTTSGGVANPLMRQ
ncbi:peptidylprolyl isomerase [Lacunimicrobium album]